MGEEIRMKALSVKQPWANMIARGEKTIELRSWGTKHRGDLLICSSKQPNIAPAGRALAIANMVDCRPATQKDEAAACSVIWVGTDVSWVFENVRRITPFPVTGAQGLFDIERRRRHEI